MTPSKIHSQTFFGTTGLNVHTTGAATADHERTRAVDDLALRYLRRRDALDLASVLFAPLREQYVTTSGARSAKTPFGVNARTGQ